jgi:hypothetical protein
MQGFAKIVQENGRKIQFPSYVLQSYPESYHIAKEHAAVLDVNVQLKKKFYDCSFHTISFSVCHINLEKNGKMAISVIEVILMLAVDQVFTLTPQYHCMWGD